MPIPRWRRPEIGDAWWVTKIQDPASFMRFIFSHARPQSRWVIWGVYTEAAISSLSRGSAPISDRPPSFEIELTAPNSATIDLLISTFDFETDFTHHSVCDAAHCLFVSNDNLSCCWVSRTIPHDLMQSAS